MKARMTKSAKLGRALVLRDAALTLVRRMGLWEAVGAARRATSGAGDMKFLSARVGGLHISYRTPFQQVPQADDALRYRAAQLGLTVPQNLPYGLDVYTTKKVLNIEWDDNGNVVLVSLHPGAWETELITLAKSEVP
jgi:2-polyprenyl-6-methoxyphenol hydroxylase-like FAD-dependent oxidoreductase